MLAYVIGRKQGLVFDSSQMPIILIALNFKFSAPALSQILCTKTVLCFESKVQFIDENTGQHLEWYDSEGLKTYLLNNVCNCKCLPKRLCVGSFAEDRKIVDWAVT